MKIPDRTRRAARKVTGEESVVTGVPWAFDTATRAYEAGSNPVDRNRMSSVGKEVPLWVRLSLSSQQWDVSDLGADPPMPR